MLKKDKSMVTMFSVYLSTSAADQRRLSNKPLPGQSWVHRRLNLLDCFLLDWLKRIPLLRLQSHSDITVRGRSVDLTNHQTAHSKRSISVLLRNAVKHFTCVWWVWWTWAWESLFSRQGNRILISLHLGMYILTAYIQRQQFVSISVSL
jgi:hypothetical protein